MRIRVTTTLGLMGTVACTAVFLAGYLAYDSGKGSPLLGLVIVLAAVAGVTALRTAESNRQFAAAKQRVTLRRRSTVMLKDCSIAILIVGLADSAFLSTYGLVVGGPRFFLMARNPRARDMIPEGLIAGALVAVVVCYLARRGFWHSTPARGRMFCRIASPTVVVLLWLLNMMWQRFQFCEEQAAFHDTWVAIYEGRADSPFGPLPRLRPRPEMAGYHARMRERWKHAAHRPWLRVEPDPASPQPK
jgi:hypothetical protein